MQSRLQLRVQRYGWDRAASDYGRLWLRQLEPAHRAVMRLAGLRTGERVLDVACGTGIIALQAAHAVGPQGTVVATDISPVMLDGARRSAAALDFCNVRFVQAHAEESVAAADSFDVAICTLGLMYAPDPARALRAMHASLRKDGRIVLAVWGERRHCGWAPVFPIVDAEVKSDVCPLFFDLGSPDALSSLCVSAGLHVIEECRIRTLLNYASADDACDAAFIGGPVALAWSRFTDAARKRARARYVEAIAPFAVGTGYSIPGEFVIVKAVKR